MQIKIFENQQQLAEFAARQILSTISNTQDPVIGLATGSSPVPVYKAWGDIARTENMQMGDITCFALDEYCGIPEQHPESYHSVIMRDAVQEIGLDPAKVFVPSGNGDIEKNSAEYEKQIAAAGGIDLQILGIGRSAHLGFNEPGSPFDSRTRRVELFPETISDNARFFDNIREVPKSAITQGLGTIFAAKKLLVIATGTAKAPAVEAAIKGPVTEDIPASLLQKHPDVVWCLDEDAAGLL